MVPGWPQYCFTAPVEEDTMAVPQQGLIYNTW